MNLDFVLDDKKWKAFTTRVERNLSSSQVDRVLEATAWSGLKYIIVPAMPHKTGALKRSWKPVKVSAHQWKIASDSKVALYIEEGTKAHGPKTAKFLYIPLRPGAASWRQGFVWGKDYILVKKVKGIKAQHYLEPASKRMSNLLALKFQKHLEKI